MSLENKKIAVVCDWIKDWGGAEYVLGNILELFPDADIYTSVFWQEGNPAFKGRKIYTSFLQKIPILNKSHKLALTLRPRAFESFDLGKYDIVISSSSAESKGIITKPETIHFCYCHTPTRYFWSHYHDYFNRLEFGILNFLAKFFMPILIHKLRIWDFVASARVDYFIANSVNTAGRIAKYYRRNSKVIYPSIDVNKFPFNDEKEDFYLYVGRVIPYKKFDLIVDSFNENGKNLILVTNTDNKLYRELKAKSKKNIIWKLNISRSETLKLFSKAKAVLFPPEEDFGLVPLDAMACGTPVIAYGKGGSLETVREKHKYLPDTGIFFENQTVESLNNAIERFETLEFDYAKIREYSYNFDTSNFKKEFIEFIEEKIKENEKK